MRVAPIRGASVGGQNTAARFATLVGCAGLAMLTLADGCSDTSDGTSHGLVARNELLAQFAAKICDHLAPCCRANGTAYDSTSCRRQAEAALSMRNVAVSSAWADYDATAAQQCLDAYVSSLPACSADVDWGALPLDFPTALAPAACARVFTGKLPAGTTCKSSKECAQPVEGSAYCDLGYFGSGTCVVLSVAAPRAKAGGACAGECSATASQGACSNCRSTGNSGVCYGPDVDADHPVISLCYGDDSLYCQFISPTAGSVCVPAGALGQPCGNGRCVGSAICSPDDICVPLSVIGEACPGTETCVPGAFCDDGVCAAQRDTGPCGTVLAGGQTAVDRNACTSNSFCDALTANCTPKKADGAPCSQIDSCLSVCRMERKAGGTGATSGAANQATCAKRTFPSEPACAGDFG
jgi:hypothetical protein